jgi:protein TonB
MRGEGAGAVHEINQDKRGGLFATIPRGDELSGGVGGWCAARVSPPAPGDVDFSKKRRNAPLNEVEAPMNIERYKMPAIIAASLHGALFLVIPENTIGNPAGPADEPSVRAIPVSDPIPEDITPPEERETLVPAGGGKALPQSPDIPPLTQENPPFTVPVSRYTTTIDPVKDLMNYRGEPMGPGTGIGDLANVGIPGIALLDRVPRAMVQPSPQYPDELRRQGVAGSVTVSFIVDTEGRVVKADVVSSTHRGFEESAVRAVLRWRFEPGTQSGRKVSFRMAVPIEFYADR